MDRSPADTRRLDGGRRRHGGVRDSRHAPGLTITIAVTHARRRETLAARSSPALLLTRVTVTECYFHCAKAFLRSDLWKPETWPEKMTISFGEEIAESGGLQREAIAEFDRAVGERYKIDL